jgi:hypothetical protein
MLSFDLQLYLSFSVSVVEVSMKKVKLNEDMNIWLKCFIYLFWLIDCLALNATFNGAGNKVDFVVWPVLYLHKDGPVLNKGVVQPIPQ